MESRTTQEDHSRVPPPDLSVTLADAIAMSGAHRGDLDIATCLAQLSSLIIGMGAHYLRIGGHSAAADEFETLRAEALDDLWTYLDRQGPPGAVAQRKIRDHFNGTEVVVILADLIRGAECARKAAGPHPLTDDHCCPPPTQR